MNWQVHVAKNTRLCDETSRAGMKTSDTHACAMRSRRKALRVARVVRRNERDIHVTDHGERAELRRAETEEVQLLEGVRCVSVGWDIQRPGKHTSVLTRRRSCRRRSRALDNEKYMFSFLVKIKIKYSKKN